MQLIHLLFVSLTFLVPICTYGHSEYDTIPYPENKISFSAYLTDSYVKTYCDYLHKEFNAKKVITRSRLYHIAWNGICLPWLQKDGYSGEGKAMDYYFMKLQSVAYSNCEILRDHFHLIFDNANASNDTLIRQHRKMIDVLAHLEDTSTAGLKPTPLYQESIVNFRNILKRFSPLLFFNIKHKGNKTYQIDYYYFNPGGDIEWAIDSRNHVMRVDLVLDQNEIKEFTVNTDFERFNWLSMHIEDLLKTIFIDQSPPAPMWKE